MHFLADMGISPIVIVHLRAQGHDATHLREQGLHRLPDSDIVVKAAMEKRVLLTSDLDFGYLVAISRSSLPSIVLFRLSDMRPMTVTSHLDNVLLQHESELAKGALIVVTDSRIRVRLLPIGRDLTDKI